MATLTYTQAEIDELISCPKRVSSAPRSELRRAGAFWRNDMRMVSAQMMGDFGAFIRRSDDFPEDFSVGLTYDPKDGTGSLVLLRCNGKHGVFSGTFDPAHPHWGFHIHRATAAAIQAGQKPEKHATSTKCYASLEEAVQHFLKLINLDVAEASRYFPDKTGQAALPLGDEVE